MRLYLAVLVGKIISYLSRKFKIGGGLAAPGLIALKIDKDLVEKLGRKIPLNIVITGTNGKTTTARMLAHFAKEAGLKVIRNHTGSNLERGIASTLISRFPHLISHFQLGIWELDEVAFNSVVPKIKPDIVVFLNVFRDQLDRYGEVDNVVKGWSNTLKSLASRSELTTQTLVLVNGDDTNCAKLKSFFKGQIYQFGVKDYKIVGESIEHLKEQENLDFEAKNVKLNGLNGSIFQLTINDERLTINLPLPGIYHIYDVLAAIACASLLNLPIQRLTGTLKHFSPAFGRVEKFILNPRSHRISTSEVGVKRYLGSSGIGYIFLIKNPAGATQVFQTIAPQIKPQDRLFLALNDNLADGTDVSWIWDVDFELFQNPSRAKSRDLNIFVSGTRAHDLANRLKYAGFDSKSITIELELENAFREAAKALKGRLFVLPTYTAMLELQRILAKDGLKRDYWEEEG